MEEVTSVTPDEPPAPPPDPALAAEQQQAQNSLVAGLRTETQGDMASLMARYGTQLALAGSSSGSPLATVPSRGVL